MTIEVAKNDGKVVPKLPGRMDAVSATAFDDEAERVIPVIVAELSGPSCISNLSLRMVGKLLQEWRGSLRLCGLAGLVKRAFEITRLDSVCPIHNSVESALSAV